MIEDSYVTTTLPVILLVGETGGPGERAKTYSKCRNLEKYGSNTKSTMTGNHVVVLTCRSCNVILMYSLGHSMFIYLLKSTHYIAPCGVGVEAQPQIQSFCLLSITPLIVFFNLSEFMRQYAKSDSQLVPIRNFLQCITEIQYIQFPCNSMHCQLSNSPHVVTLQYIAAVHRMAPL